jgi:tripartite-type tricarboxylate transporter receptor subunit TctC
MAGIKLNHVPYRGTAPALTDLLGGHVGLMFATMPSALGLVRDGKVRALAVTGPRRSALLPDLPTVAEAGPLPGFEAVLHYGIVAPAGMPRPLVEKLSAAMKAALNEADVRERIAADGAEVMWMTPEDYAADIDREETKWSKVVKLSGAKVD